MGESNLWPGTDQYFSRSADHRKSRGSRRRRRNKFTLAVDSSGHSFLTVTTVHHLVDLSAKGQRSETVRTVGDWDRPDIEDAKF